MNFPNATVYETMKGSQKQLWRQGAPLPFSLTIVSTKRNSLRKLQFVVLLDYHSHMHHNYLCGQIPMVQSQCAL